MTYTCISDYIAPRIQQETKARERIRAEALTAFFTCYTSAKSFALTFANIKRWYDGGYLSSEQIFTLYSKGIITYSEGEAITGEDWEGQLPDIDCEAEPDFVG